MTIFVRATTCSFYNVKCDQHLAFAGEDFAENLATPRYLKSDKIK